MPPCYVYFPFFRALDSRFPQVSFRKFASGRIIASASWEPRKTSAVAVAVKRSQRKGPLGVLTVQQAVTGFEPMTVGSTRLIRQQARPLTL